MRKAEVFCFRFLKRIGGELEETGYRFDPTSNAISCSFTCMSAVISSVPETKYSPCYLPKVPLRWGVRGCSVWQPLSAGVVRPPSFGTD